MFSIQESKVYSLEPSSIYESYFLLFIEFADDILFDEQIFIPWDVAPFRVYQPRRTPS
jgi:hypothetical protein